MALAIRRSGRTVPPPPDTRHYSHEYIRRACWRGELPAECLTYLGPREIEQLVYDLWHDGWTDFEIATHTAMTTYTTARIRDRLGLRAHRARKVPA